MKYNLLNSKFLSAGKSLSVSTWISHHTSKPCGFMPCPSLASFPFASLNVWCEWYSRITGYSTFDDSFSGLSIFGLKPGIDRISFLVSSLETEISPICWAAMPLGFTDIFIFIGSVSPISFVSKASSWSIGSFTSEVSLSSIVYLITCVCGL